jgi:hypothetical protein
LFPERAKNGEAVARNAYAGGFVPMLNGLGFMSTRMDIFMEAFIAFAKTSLAPVADIGAAYGVATIPALEREPASLQWISTRAISTS